DERAGSHAQGHHARLRAAISALDWAAPQRRPKYGRFYHHYCDAAGRRQYPRRAVHFWNARARPGAWRFCVAGCCRPPCPARASAGAGRRIASARDDRASASGDTSMNLGFVGLGKMGLNMVTRLTRGGHQIVAYDRDAHAVTNAAAVGANGVTSLDALVSSLTSPRAVWVMVPAGPPTDSTVAALGERLSAGDAIIDGGNTNFHDDVRRAETLARKGIEYVDAGTSGGIWG